MIKLRNVSHAFSDETASDRVLKDINLNIYQQEIFGLVGDTGSGKSTLLRIMNGYITPTRGEIELMKQPLNPASRNDLVKKTSLIFQDFNLLSNLNVLDNVMLPHKLRKHNDSTLAYQYLKYVGLEGFEHRKINSLSGGQKQRVAIARTLMSQPEIIFCDEPTSALDSNMRNEILNLLKSINQDLGTTIVIVSHDTHVIKSLCDRVGIIENGTIEHVLKISKEDIVFKSFIEELSL